METGAKHPGGRPRKEVDLGELRRLLAEGHSVRCAAKQLGLGYGTVHRAAQALALPGVDDPKLAGVIQNPAA